MKRAQLTITYPEHEAEKLYRTLLLLRDQRCLNVSAFCRPAEVVAPELIGCRLVKRQTDGSLLWGVVVEMEANSQDAPSWY